MKRITVKKEEHILNTLNETVEEFHKRGFEITID